MGAVPSVEGCVAPFRFLPYSLKKIIDRGGLRWRKKLDGLGENMRHRAVVVFFSSFLFLAKLLLLFFVLLDAFGTKKGTERGIRKGFRSGFKDFQN
jgi:hypothetical protein